MYVVALAWACVTSALADPRADPLADRNPQPTKVVLGQSTPEEDSKTGPSRPGCGSSEKYCLINSDYPLDKVNAIIDRYYNNVLHLYNDLYRFPPHDIMYHDNRTHGYRHGGHFVCESAVQYVRPGWAQNIRGEWVAVINTDKYPQSVRVESCKYRGKRCEFLPPCYKSKCVQRHTYVKLLSVDPYRPEYKPTVDVFEIPSACSCFVEDFIYY
ncbi:neurotrophin 1-like isoform X1 [Penaeus monodon]|uniref:neurotrophin 1-like isoform X1 n=1 Tax=Penaeus monodon TaxID=6687 RepID=UPI0018A7251D|nr:neurotrophin 1-like isoform X1 [Penaeus monodon]